MLTRNPFILSITLVLAIFGIASANGEKKPAISGEAYELLGLK